MKSELSKDQYSDNANQSFHQFDLALTLSKQYATRMTSTRYDEMIYEGYFQPSYHSNDNHKK